MRDLGPPLEAFWSLGRPAARAEVVVDSLNSSQGGSDVYHIQWAGTAGTQACQPGAATRTRRTARSGRIAGPDRLGELGATRTGRVRGAYVHAQRDQRRLGERGRDADRLRRGAHVRRNS